MCEINNKTDENSVEGLEAISDILARLDEHFSNPIKDDFDPRINSFGIYDGIPHLSGFIMGNDNPCFTIMGSRPGVGKSNIALGTALHVAKSSGKTVAFFSYEMLKWKVVLRQLAMELSNGNKDFMKLTWDKNNRRLANAIASLSSADLLISDDASLSVSDIHKQCRDIPKLGLVVIDYLQLLPLTELYEYDIHSESKAIVDLKISKRLKNMSQKLNVPVLCLSQLSRRTEERECKRPRISDFETPSIAQCADIVIGLYSDRYYFIESENPDTIECCILKNRRDETDVWFNLTWTPRDRIWPDGI